MQGEVISEFSLLTKDRSSKRNSTVINPLHRIFINQVRLTLITGEESRSQQQIQTNFVTNYHQFSTVQFSPQSCPILWDPMNHSTPTTILPINSSKDHLSFLAAIHSLPKESKYLLPNFIKIVFLCVSHSFVSNSLWPLWTIARQSPLSMEFPRQEY